MTLNVYFRYSPWCGGSTTSESAAMLWFLVGGHHPRGVPEFTRNEGEGECERSIIHYPKQNNMGRLGVTDVHCLCSQKLAL